MPTCWPPQVVDGKNVGGDAPGGGGAAFGIPSGGGGRGGLLGALMGGRGGGGPLAFIRRKSVKPAVPKLKQLHWDTLDSTEGTLWAENPTKIGLVCVSFLLAASDTGCPHRPSLTTHSLTSQMSSLPHRKKMLLPKLPKTCPALLGCLDLARISRCGVGCLLTSLFSDGHFGWAKVSEHEHHARQVREQNQTE